MCVVGYIWGQVMHNLCIIHGGTKITVIVCHIAIIRKWHPRCQYNHQTCWMWYRTIQTGLYSVQHALCQQWWSCI